jgi:hypothetical protein
VERGGWGKAETIREERSRKCPGKLYQRDSVTGFLSLPFSNHVSCNDTTATETAADVPELSKEQQK